MRMLDLAAFNVFDFDSYGCPGTDHDPGGSSPMAKGERIGLVPTGGAVSTCCTVASRTAAPSDQRARFIAGAGFRRDVIEQAIGEIARRLGGRITQRWETVGKTGAKIRYIGLILEAV